MIAPLGSVALAIAFFENCSSHTVPPVFSIYVVFATNTISKDQSKVERELQSKMEKDRGKNEANYTMSSCSGDKKAAYHWRQRCNPSPEISVGLETLRANLFNFDHFPGLVPSQS